MTAPMPETMSPREKVARIIDPAAFLFTADELMKGDPSQFNALAKADQIFAALASSGDHAELARLAEAATPGPWTNIDALRGEKKSVWVADTAREETERDGVTPSRYGPSRTTICNALASNYSLPDGGYKTLDPYPNAAFIAAANPATVLALLAENAALRAESESARTVVAWANNSLFGSCGYFHGDPYDGLHLARPIEALKDRTTEAERKLAEAVGLLEWARDELPEINPSNYDHDDACHLNAKSVEVTLAIISFLSKEAERGQ